MGIGFAFASIIHITIVFVRDFVQGHGMTVQEVEVKMRERNVVNFADVQGSRVYIVDENKRYVHYVFSIGMVNSRYRFMWRTEDEVSIFPGRWSNFRVQVRGLDITYEPYRYSSPHRYRHFPLPLIISFILHNITGAKLAYDAIEKREFEKYMATRSKNKGS